MRVCIEKVSSSVSFLCVSLLFSTTKSNTSPTKALAHQQHQHVAYEHALDLNRTLALYGSLLNGAGGRTLYDAIGGVVPSVVINAALVGGGGGGGSGSDNMLSLDPARTALGVVINICR